MKDFNIFNIFKKKDVELAQKQEKAMTANQFVNVRDVKNGIVYGKNDKNLYSYLRIQPINLELLSQTEQDIKIKNLASEFSTQKKSYKIFTIPRPVDVSHMIIMLKTLKEESTDTMQKALLTEEIKELSEFALSGEFSEKQFYLIIWEKDSKDGERELMKRASELIYRFSNCKVDVKLCSDSEVVKLFNLFGNPNYAHLEDEDSEEYIPLIAK